MGSPRLIILLYLALVCFALIFSVEARTARRPFKKRAEVNPVPVNESGYTLPLSNGTSSLPGPPADTNLIAIGIGRGVEYYTCDNATAVPNHTGGKADLYDANDIIQYLPNEGYLHDLVKYFYNYDYGLLENSSLQALGSIYYAPKPTYDLGELGFFQGTVDYAVDSPLTNYYVRAINWAQLSNFPGNSTIHHVFRVETFGGGGPCTCEGQPQISTWQYAAEYWFYV